MLWIDGKSFTPAVIRRLSLYVARDDQDLELVGLSSSTTRVRVDQEVILTSFSPSTAKVRVDQDLELVGLSSSTTRVRVDQEVILVAIPNIPYNAAFESHDDAIQIPRDYWYQGVQQHLDGSEFVYFIRPPTFTGVWSMGFDMNPTVNLIFNSSNGGMSNTITPFSWGYVFTLGDGISNEFSFYNNLTTLIQGVRIYLDSYPASTSTILQWQDDTAGSPQVTLRVSSTGALQFYLGSSGTTLGPASAAGTIPVAVWTYLQTTVTINSSTGKVELYINSQSSPVISTSGLNTKNTSNPWVSGMIFQGATTTGLTRFDDWYMLDTTSPSPFNTYLGNVQVRGDAPNANSATGGRNAWSPTTPTGVNWENEANIPANLTQFDSDTNPGDYDMFQFPAIPTTKVIFINEWALIGQDGGRTVALNYTSGGTDSLGTAFSPSTTPAYVNSYRLLDPNTGLSWTVAAAGAAELGAKVVS
jgi:hypothetical protein